MPDESATTLEVQFSVHGATCAGCKAEIRIHHHTEETAAALVLFHAKHSEHPSFSWLCSIASPPELVNGQLLEMRIGGTRATS